MNGPKLLGGAAKIGIALVVLFYLGLQSLNFFTFVFPAEQVFYAYLGFGLTGGGLLCYLAVFKWSAETDLQKTVAMVMIFVCAIGELATAGFGMQVEAWKALGMSLTADDLDMMINAVRVLALFHALALIFDFVGDGLLGFFNIALPVSLFARKSSPSISRSGEE